MQSLLQYRRLRQDVQDELAQCRSSIASRSSTSSYKSKDESDTQAQDSTIALPGVALTLPDEEHGSIVYYVGWSDNDPSNPRAWSMTKKWLTTLTTCLMTITLIIPSSVDGATQEAFNKHFGVNDLAGSMTTGIYLIGIGVGSLFSGPFSETCGRNAVYISTMIIVMLFIMGKALAPNYGAAIAFRFLTALFAAAPMTVMGGTVGDIWTSEQIAFGLPFTTFAGYAGPILGPVIGAYTPQIGFEWAD